jgi:hypothetical protein
MHTVLMGTAIRTDTPAQARRGAASRSASRRRPSRPPKTLNQNLTASAAQALAGLANQYGDSEHEEFYASLEAQAHRWASVFMGDPILDVGI